MPVRDCPIPTQLPRAPASKAQPANRRPGKARDVAKRSHRVRLLDRFWNESATLDLSPAEKAAWLLLWWHADSRGVCRPSMTRIGERVGVSHRQAKRLVAVLRDGGFLRVLNRGSNVGRNRANRYQLLVPTGESK